MSKASPKDASRRGTREIEAADVLVIPPVPPVPPRPQTAEDQAASAERLRYMQEIHHMLRNSNIGTAMALAKQAQAWHTAGHAHPLEDHLCELGRRFSEMLLQPMPAKGGLRLIEGGSQ